MSVVDLQRPGVGAVGVQYLSDSIRLAPHPGSVGVARLHVRQVLRGWNLSVYADDAEQVVSEVVTNAIQAHEREEMDTEVRMTLIAGLGKVLIVVRDFGGDGDIVPRQASLDAESGRGLFIVDALAEWWGVRSLPGGGKAVRILLGGRRNG